MQEIAAHGIGKGFHESRALLFQQGAGVEALLLILMAVRAFGALVELFVETLKAAPQGRLQPLRAQRCHRAEQLLRARRPTPCADHRRSAGPPILMLGVHDASPQNFATEFRRLYSARQRVVALTP